MDRFPDKTGNYGPGNCRWATWNEQQNIGPGYDEELAEQLRKAGSEDVEADLAALRALLST